MVESVMEGIRGQRAVPGVVRYEDPFCFKTVVLTPEAHEQLLTEMRDIGRRVVRNPDGHVMFDGMTIKIANT